jgi:hypothetical protein
MFLKIAIFSLSILLSVQGIEANNEITPERSENIEVVVNGLVQTEVVTIARGNMTLKSRPIICTTSLCIASPRFPIVKSNLEIRLRRLLI